MIQTWKNLPQYSDLIKYKIVMHYHIMQNYRNMIIMMLLYTQNISIINQIFTPPEMSKCNGNFFFQLLLLKVSYFSVHGHTTTVSYLYNLQGNESDCFMPS